MEELKPIPAATGLRGRVVQLSMYCMSDGVSKETKAVMQTARRKATDQGI